MKFIPNYLSRIFRAGRRGVRKLAGSTMSRLTLDWVMSPLSIDREIREDLGRLRARTRDLGLNNPYVRNYLALVVTNVIGPKGIRMQGNVRDSKGIKNKAVNWKLEDHFLSWGRSVSADGRLTWQQFCRQAARIWATDGEVFVRLVVGDFNEYNFAVEFVDADLIDHTYNVAAGPDSNEIRLGVEVNKWGRPEAYYVWTRHESDPNGQRRERIRVPAKEMIHLYDPDRAGQTRGISVLNSVMQTLKMLDGYAEAELVSARTASAKMGFLKYTDAATMQLEDDVPDSPLKYDATPGSIEMLPPGLDFVPWNPDHPTTGFGEFMRSVLRQVASGLQVTYNSLTGDMTGVNYSSLRSGLLIERDMWRTLQQLFIDRLYRPVFAQWYEMAVISGKVTVKLDAYVDVNWVARGWDWVDPQKDINAQVIAINNGLASRTAVLAETGEDFDLIADQLADEKATAEAMGLTFGAVQTTQVVERPANDEDEVTQTTAQAA